MSAITIVAGLGNPDPEYARTRHNIGFLVADELAARVDARFKRSKHEALVAEARADGERLILAKPQTYMNNSGRSVAALSRFYKVPLDQIIVVHDELDLPFGVVRVKLSGGPGGHNGVLSVIQAIGPDFVRVRLGIGRPSGRKDPVDFVLEPFRKAEEPAVPAMVDAGAEAVQMIVREGVGRTQTEFNRRAERDPT